MSDTSNALTTINTDINIEEISLSEKRKKNYIELRENKLNGNLNGIPLFYTFPKLASILPSLPKGFQILWTANSGVGKTQSWISIFVYTIWYLKKYHPDYRIEMFDKVSECGKAAKAQVDFMSKSTDMVYQCAFAEDADKITEMVRNKVKAFIRKLKRRKKAEHENC